LISLNKGFFVSFEGLDGCGKSTQMSLLAEYFKDKGFRVTITFEPGATRLGKIIREVLLRPEDVARSLNVNPVNLKIDYVAEALLYAADRAQHVNDVIRPALTRGDFVLSDRYIDSSVAYQGYVRGLGKDLIRLINEKAMGSLYPNLTFFLDVPVNKMKYRLANREADRIESEKQHFHEAVRKAYLQIAGENPERFVVINSNRRKKLVFDELVSHVEQRLKSK
jgi:dTMP kinase